MTSMLLAIAIAASTETGDLEGLLNEAVLRSASGTTEDHTSAPGFVTVISAESLRAHNIRSLDEALNYLAINFHIVPHYDGSSLQGGARGLVIKNDQAAHLLVLLDGHALNNHFNGGVWLDEGLGVPFEALDAIEIVLGPGSVLHGSNAMFGTINLVTKTHSTWQGGHLGVDAGTSLPNTGRGSIGQDLRAVAGGSDAFRVAGQKAEWMLAAEYRMTRTAALTFDTQDSEGVNFGPFATGALGWGGLGHREGQVAALIGALKIGELQLRLNSAWRRQGLPVWENSLFADGSSRRDSFNGGFGASWRRRVVAAVELAFHANTDLYLRDDRSAYPVEVGCPDGMLVGCRYVAKGFAGSVVLGHSTAIDWTLDGRFKTLLGGEVRWRRSQDGIDYSDLSPNPVPPQPASRWTQSRWSGALFAQQELRPNQNVAFNAGARLELDQFFGVKLVPRLAMIGWLTASTPLKLIYTEGFRAPTAQELEEHDNTYQIANHDLRPENVRSVDVIVEQRFERGYAVLGTFFSYYEGLVSTRTLSPSELDRAVATGQLLPGLSPTNVFIYDNATSTQTVGVNAAVDVKPMAELSLAAGVSVAAVQQAAVPTFTATARASYQPGLRGHVLSVASVITSPASPAAKLDGSFTNVPDTPWQVSLRLSVSGPLLWKLRYRVSLTSGNATTTPYLVGPSPFSADPAHPQYLSPREALSGFAGTSMDW